MKKILTIFLSSILGIAVGIMIALLISIFVSPEQEQVVGFVVLPILGIVGGVIGYVRGKL